jgi:hypothetical protein
MIVYSANADADRAFLRDVLGFPHVDVGGGWLIFGLPSSEIAIHPAQNNGEHEIYLMVDDVRTFVASMAGRGLSCTDPRDQGWGVLTSLTLPGGGQLGVYEPRHARPASVEPLKRKATTRRRPQATRRVAKKATKKATKKAAKKKTASRRAGSRTRR